LAFLKCCEKCGLDPSETLLFYKEYLYPHRDLIKNYLESQNYERIHSLDSIDEVLREVQDIWQKNEKPILIIEDGGYVVPRVHTRFKTIGKKVIGAVEQTTKGEKEDKKVEKLYFPVLSVASSKFKRNYEPPHIAREVVHSIRELIRRDLSSVEALLIGYGSIGSEIARELKSFMNVTVTDKDEVALAGAASHGFRIVKRIEDAVKNRFLIISATGATEESTIARSELLAMDHETHLVSASSDQVEIDLGDLEALAEKKEDILLAGKKIGTKYILRGNNNAINLIADGFPINFWYRESMPNEVSDLILSLILATAIELAQNYKSYRKEVNSEEVDTITRKYGIAKMYLELREKA